MNKFKKWIDKLFANKNKTEKKMDKRVEPSVEDTPKEETPQEIEQKIKTIDIDYKIFIKENGFILEKYHTYHSIRNKLFRGLTIAKIKQYDAEKMSENPKYIRNKYTFQNEEEKKNKEECTQYLNYEIESLKHDVISN